MHQERSTKAIAAWIYIGIVMLIVQVLLGGITRLTGSGLSITEWKPIVGALPPTSEMQWQQAFQKYQQIAQYKYLNTHFALENFKFIFFWEWLHRLWARLIGIVFLLPFIYFLAKKYFKKWMVLPLLILFLLGALQGAVGWLMVKSGLNETDVYVNHIRLAIHFMTAMLLICYSLVFALKLSLNTQQQVSQPGLLKGAVIITILISLQLIYGSFMAGLKAAQAAPTFPDINGMFIPQFAQGGFFNNIFHNKLVIHFIHRTLAYAIAIAIIIWWLRSKGKVTSEIFKKVRNLALLLVLLQFCLGIFTVLNSVKIATGKFGVFEWFAILHQLTGMMLLLVMVSIIYILGKRNNSISKLSLHNITPHQQAAKA